MQKWGLNLLQIVKTAYLKISQMSFLLYKAVAKYILDRNLYLNLLKSLLSA